MKDLLSNSVDESLNLEIREDPIKGIYVTGIKERECTNVDEIMEYLV